MEPTPIRFDNGESYERYMGVWSQLAGAAFLDWLAPRPAKRWLDVGCGNGAFTELLVARCRPASIHGIDPSEAQLVYARQRPALRTVDFRAADAMALPFPNQSFDAAVMPLVIFFVPDPAKGVAEMARVVAPGGLIAAYAWDIVGGGFPYESLWNEMRALGVDVPLPPSHDASRIDVMRELWTDAGLTKIKTRQITVERTFESFDDYWTTIHGGPSVSRGLKTMTPDELDKLKGRLQSVLISDGDGRITYSAQANAVKGFVK